MSNVKIEIKIGPLEMSYDGPQDFAEIGLLTIIERVTQIDLPDIVAPTAVEPPSIVPGHLNTQEAQKAKLSTTDFAVKLGVKSGSDLVMAAAACIHHMRGLEEFKRSELLAEMKAAKAFYRSSYGGNLSKSLDMLTKSGRLQNPKADTYALPYPEIQSSSMLL